MAVRNDDLELDVSAIGAAELRWAKERAQQKGTSVAEVITVALLRAWIAEEDENASVSPTEAAAFAAFWRSPR
ncbi:MAG: hypothetical protein AAGF12_12130 [Myxococcota bacterium]